MTQFSDTKIILNELEQLFNRDDDIKDILDIKKMLTEIDAQSSMRLGDAKEIINGKYRIMHCANYIKYKT